jgi:hypothetical protein
MDLLVKEPHLLRVEQDPERFARLIEAAKTAGLRVGWLDLRRPDSLPADLEAAASAGAMRAVAVGEGRSLVVKPLRGEPVLRDLLREHFLGCALVLVRGEVEAPSLREDGERWTVAVPGEAARDYALGGLVAELRRPNVWRRKPDAQPEQDAE